MLALSLTGVHALLDLLRRMNAGHTPSDAELDAVIAANDYFFGYYAGWPDTGREALKGALRHFQRPEHVPTGTIATRMAEGFRRAVARMDEMEERLAWLRQVNPSAVARRVCAYLPTGTPLEATIHITVDAFNNAFAHRGGMGVSLLEGAADRGAFEGAVSHELHHLGVAYWAHRDAIRTALENEPSGRAVAVLHVGNLLSEGLANHYLTPAYVYRAAPDSPPSGPYAARLARLAREEGALMARVEEILALCLRPGADHATCLVAYRSLAWDMEEHMLPAGHYLGARMVATMAAVRPLADILACIVRLPLFLPRYNDAARATGAYAFDDGLVARFARLWEGEAE